jgi:magnesium-transporting ATPase (P-type)
MRVLGVAQKNDTAPMSASSSAADECEHDLIGYLAFLDPPKANGKGCHSGTSWTWCQCQGADR